MIDDTVPEEESKKNPDGGRRTGRSLSDGVKTQQRRGGFERLGMKHARVGGWKAVSNG